MEASRARMGTHTARRNTEGFHSFTVKFLIISLLVLQAWKTGFNAQFVACQTVWLEPPAKNWPYFVMLAPAGIEIQPETWIGIPITGTASIGVNLFNECV